MSIMKPSPKSLALLLFIVQLIILAFQVCIFGNEYKFINTNMGVAGGMLFIIMIVVFIILLGCALILFIVEMILKHFAMIKHIDFSYQFLLSNAFLAYVLMAQTFLSEKTFFINIFFNVYGFIFFLTIYSITTYVYFKYKQELNNLSNNSALYPIICVFLLCIGASIIYYLIRVDLLNQILIMLIVPLCFLLGQTGLIIRSGQIKQKNISRTVNEVLLTFIKLEVSGILYYYLFLSILNIL